MVAAKPIGTQSINAITTTVAFSAARTIRPRQDTSNSTTWTSLAADTNPTTTATTTSIATTAKVATATKAAAVAVAVKQLI